MISPRAPGWGDYAISDDRKRQKYTAPGPKPGSAGNPASPHETMITRRRPTATSFGSSIVALSYYQMSISGIPRTRYSRSPELPRRLQPEAVMNHLHRAGRHRDAAGRPRHRIRTGSLADERTGRSCASLLP